jgi:hypothetical protein
MALTNPNHGMPRALEPNFTTPETSARYTLGTCWRDGMNEYVYVYFNEDISQGFPCYLLDGFCVAKLPATSIAVGLTFAVNTLADAGSTYYGFVQRCGVCTNGLLVPSGASMGAPLYFNSSTLAFTTSPTSDLDCYMFKNIYTTESGATTASAVDGWIGL